MKIYSVDGKFFSDFETAANEGLKKKFFINIHELNCKKRNGTSEILAEMKGKSKALTTILNGWNLDKDQVAKAEIELNIYNEIIEKYE
tara:strand:+ start:51 stop:314 length:264 start_codon:yes stop_codon:yes gene_type:complete